MSDLLIHVSRRAMASEFEVRFPADERSDATEVAIEALDRVEALEKEISYFIPESELSRVNILAADGPVAVSPTLFELLATAMRIYEETGGAYDITATAIWEVWGFSRRVGRVPSDAEIAEARSRVGCNLVELDHSQKTVRFLKPGVRLNLGSIGKGHALDICADCLTQLGMKNFLLHGGQSSILARGRQTPAGVPWEIGIRNPLQPNRRQTTVPLRDRALGTSGGQFQGFRHAGKRYGHILDPRSGWPAQNMLSATVLAPTAALADALSTAFYVLGPEKSLEYCQKHPEIGAVLITPSTNSGEISVTTANLPSAP